MKQDQITEREELAIATAGMSRRRFFGMAGGFAAVGLIIGAEACKKKDDNNSGVDLGSGDTGILNYAYALEQLEAAFYTQVIKTPYTSMSASESTMLNDIMLHEIAHREFFKAALGSSAIIGLTPNFSSVDFTNRASVLGTAMAFEDLGVAAYNGAAHLISSADYLTLAGKIVSVEARHAAYIRELLTPNSFADLSSSNLVSLGDSNTNGLDAQASPTVVLSIAGKYITNTINASNLPQ